MVVTRKRGVVSEPKFNFEEDATDDTRLNSISAIAHALTQCYYIALDYGRVRDSRSLLSDR
jgi:hypothetical protein